MILRMYVLVSLRGPLPFTNRYWPTFKLQRQGELQNSNLVPFLGCLSILQVKKLKKCLVRDDREQLKLKRVGRACIPSRID